MLTYFLIFLSFAMFCKTVHEYVHDRFWLIGWPFKSLEVWKNWGILSILCVLLVLGTLLGGF